MLLDTIVQIPRETRSLLQARILLGQDLFARLVRSQLLGHLVKMGFELSDLVCCRRGEVLVVLTFGKTSRRRANAAQASDESPGGDDAKDSANQGYEHNSNDVWHHQLVPGQGPMRQKKGDVGMGDL